jgi:hypothetical protein
MQKIFIAGIASVGAIFVLATGCKQSNPEPMSDAETNSLTTSNTSWQNIKESGSNAVENVKQAGEQTWNNVKEGSTQAWANAKESLASASDYTYDKKDEFVTKAQADLDALKVKMQELSDKATNATASAQAEAETKVAELQAKQGQLDQKLDAVKNSTAEHWDNVKTDFTDAYDSTTNSLAQAWQWLKDKTQ